MAVLNARSWLMRGRRRMLLASVALLLVSGLAGKAGAQSPAGMVAVVNDPEGLHLRAGPGTQYRSLAVIPNRTELPVLGEWLNSVWAPVTYQDKRGFINVAYTTIRGQRSAGAPAPSATATPAPSTTPASPASSPQTDNGVVLVRVTAADSDDMITIGDAFALTAVVRLPAGVSKVEMQLSGAAFLSASGTFPVQAGDNHLHVPAFRVDSEWEPLLRDAVIRKVGGTLPIRDGALELVLKFQEPGGSWRTAAFQPSVVLAERPAEVARIQYPDLKRITGLPPRGAGEQSFYLRGDADFHHPADYYVRKLAIEAARRGGAFPDDPEQVADNIFHYINNLLGDADPGDFNNDINIAEMIENGEIERGRRNGGYICIAQTYLMTALTRTLGLPSRELNIAVGRPEWLGNDGAWRVTWWQEAAVHTWYNGRWNHYDLWLGFKGMSGYFEKNVAYQAWAAFAPRATPFITVGGASTGLRGHNFAVWPGNPPHWEFIGEGARPGVEVALVREGADLPLSTSWLKLEGEDASPDLPDVIGAPPAKGILDPGPLLPTP